MMKKKGKYTVIIFLMLIISLMSSFFIAFDRSKPVEYEYLFILPMLFSLICISMVPILNRYSSNISIWIIFILYFIRNVINPFFMYLGNYSSLFLLSSRVNINKAIFLMIYETFMVFLTINIYINRKKILTIKNRFYRKRQTKLKVIGLALVMLTIFCFLSFMTVPAISGTYNTIFNAESVVSNNYINVNANVAYGSIQRVLFTLTLFLIPILQILLPLTIYIYMKKKYGENRWCVVLAMIIMFLNFLFISDNNIDVFIITIVLSLMLIKLYPKYSRFICTVIGSVLVLGIVVLIVAKTNTNMLTSDNPFEAITKFLQAYFQGVNNVAGGFSIVNDSKVKSLFFDFFDMIPFRNTIFSGISGDRLVKLYCISNNVNSQIIPSISQSYYYLSFILAPILPMIIVTFSIRAFNKSSLTKNVYRSSYYLSNSIYLTFATAVNNFTIYGTTYLNLILPLFILSTLAGSEVEIQNTV
ncbi:hypothetical protein NNC19_12605 [Clostridium sp. SHJSY1]|uniref:hypothetical protein n=1 Tax=Clostridium sp. SHJSY1 TaxID=2942483 RepID=UPI002875C564|nr:hypothetical protein [Clostridium sp. SHJSY1]MDS0526524.1 hypothetical protein [Clostridium sp. SHJSY1]